jgi:predicted MFS family arabinose efflux permease
MERGSGGIYYGWYLVALCFVVNFLVLGLATHSFTVYMKPLEETFAWSRKAISAAMAFATLAMALAAPSIGRLIDRVGARVVMALGAGVLGVSALLLSRTESLWHFYVLYAIAGVGQGAATVIPISVVISNWFHAKRGRALGIVMTGTGLGAIVIVPLTTWMVVHWGWRTAFFVGGCIILSVIPLNLLFIRTSPAEKGLMPDGGIVAEGEAEDLEGITVREAVRTTSFWLIGTMMLLSAFVGMGILFHLMPYLTDIGHSAGTAALVIALYGGFTVVGKILIGLVVDRRGVRPAVVLTYGMILAGVLLLMGSKGFVIACAFAVIYGFAAGAPLVINPALAAACVGLRHFGAIFGVLTLISTFGVAAGAFFTGAVYDAAKSYIPVFALFVVLTVVAGACGTMARKEKEALH